MIKEILEYSFKNNLGHIPSALSMSIYVPIIFKFINRNNNIIIGKPFGSQTYYLTWKDLGWLENIEKLHMGVKHDEIDFIDYSEETIGNALGVASGIELANKKKTYVNISDGCLQMGPTLEAIQFIGKHQQNILVTVDYNNSQVTGNCNDIIPVEPTKYFFSANRWIVYEIDGHNEKEIFNIMNIVKNITTPVVIFFKTKKGYGVPQMEEENWHYRKLDEKNFTQILNSVKA
mgnify:CR=1 FL=1